MGDWHEEKEALWGLKSSLFYCILIKFFYVIGELHYITHYKIRMLLTKKHIGCTNRLKKL